MSVRSSRENVRLLLVILKEHTTLNSAQVILAQKVCMRGKCSKCANAIHNYNPANKSHPEMVNHMEKVDKMSRVEDCFDELKTQFGPFLLHTYVKRKQAT